MEVDDLHVLNYFEDDKRHGSHLESFQYLACKVDDHMFELAWLCDLLNLFLFHEI